MGVCDFTVHLTHSYPNPLMTEILASKGDSTIGVDAVSLSVSDHPSMSDKCQLVIKRGPGSVSLSESERASGKAAVEWAGLSAYQALLG